eukprot:3875518-Ditylum_brightwellii.AAC.1
MADVKLKANEVLLDVNCAATVFKDTFVSDPECGPQDLQTMVDVWFNIEKDQDMMLAVIDDELEELEREAQA